MKFDFGYWIGSERYKSFSLNRKIGAAPVCWRCSIFYLDFSCGCAMIIKTKKAGDVYAAGCDGDGLGLRSG